MKHGVNSTGLNVDMTDVFLPTVATLLRWSGTDWNRFSLLERKSPLQEERTALNTSPWQHCPPLRYKSCRLPVFRSVLFGSDSCLCVSRNAFVMMDLLNRPRVLTLGFFPYFHVSNHYAKKTKQNQGNISV